MKVSYQLKVKYNSTFAKVLYKLQGIRLPHLYPYLPKHFVSVVL